MPSASGTGVNSFPAQKGLGVGIFPFRVISVVVFQSEGWGTEAVVPGQLCALPDEIWAWLRYL